jgi:hypothetical protein
LPRVIVGRLIFRFIARSGSGPTGSCWGPIPKGYPIKAAAKAGRRRTAVGTFSRRTQVGASGFQPPAPAGNLEWRPRRAAALRPLHLEISEAAWSFGKRAGARLARQQAGARPLQTVGIPRWRSQSSNLNPRRAQGVRPRRNSSQAFLTLSQGDDFKYLDASAANVFGSRRKTRA